MKRFLLFGLLLCSIALYADDCSESLNEAKNLYNVGNYSKAKSLFEYVASECGVNYGDAAAWARKCTEKLTPQLTVSRTNISVGSSSGTTSVTVTSNRGWNLQNTSSNMFYVSKNGNTVTINYYANITSSSRSDYFDIATTDGSKSVRVTITQSGSNANSSSNNYPSATTLSVSRTSLSVGASAGSTSVTVTSNREWKLQNSSSNMFSVSKSGNTIVIKYYVNSTSYSRSGYFDIVTLDGSKSVRVTITQSGTSSSNYSGETTLSVSKSYISATAYGVIEYITVTSNRSWEIQYPSGGMYSARRDGNKVVVNISANTTYSSRSDFFNIRTTDGKKSITITLSQGAGTSSSSSSRSSSSSYQTNSSRSYGSSTYSSQSKYRQYINNQGLFEVTWCSMRLGIGSALTYTQSLMKLRLGPIQWSPLEFEVGWNYFAESESNIFCNFQPTIDAIIPVSENSAIYTGIGPMWNLIDGNIWFKIEAGWHYHWGYRASSDFFLRYDGTFCIGTSIQWSQGRY